MTQTSDELRAQAEELIKQAQALENSECTGIGAFWCPIHGDCICPLPENSKDDPECPLHSYSSGHAEGVFS